VTNIHRHIKEEQILNAAEAIFLEYGYDKASTRLITKKAGVNIALLHYYFRDKQSLFNMMVIKRINFLRNQISQPVEGKDPMEKLLNTIEHYLTLIFENQLFYRLMITELMRKDRKDIVELIELFFNRMEMQISEIINKGMEMHFFRKVNKEVIVKNIIGLFLEVIIMENETHSFQIERKEELMIYYKIFCARFLMTAIDK